MLPALLPLLSLDKKAVLRGLGLAGAGAIVILVAYVNLQSLEVDKLRARVDEATLAYQNPKVVVKVATRRVEGPVVVVTRVIEEGGRRETITEERRGVVVTTTDSLTISEPVFMPSGRSSRWLAGVSVNPFKTASPAAWTAYGGYSFGNRLDLLAGADMRGSPRALVVVRF